MQLIFTIAYRLTTYRFAPDRHSLPHKYTIRLAIFWRAFVHNLTTNKLQLTRRNQCRVFNSRSGCTHDIHLLWCEVKPPNLDLKHCSKHCSWTNLSWQDKTLAKFSTLEDAVCKTCTSMQHLPLRPNLELKTQPNQLFPLDIAFHILTSVSTCTLL